MDLRVATQMEQHAETIGQREGGDVRIEVRISLHEVAQGWEKLLEENQSIATGMRSNDGGPFVQRRLEPIRVSEGLVFSDEAELIADVTQERELPLGEGSVERFVARISRVELLRASGRIRMASVKASIFDSSVPP